MDAAENKEFKLVKPTLEDYNLSEEKIQFLNSFNEKCSKTSDKYLISSFIILEIISTLIVLISKVHFGYLALSTLISAIIAFLIVPIIFKAITSKSIVDYIYNRDKKQNIITINENNKKYRSALGDYKSKKELNERILRRRIWEYWLSLSPIGFEEAVGDLFIDKGYEVWTTKATGDHGVDLYMEKDGKKFVVQCKNYKKQVGPNAARDLLGTMVAQEAHEGFLAAPLGFTMATKEFCKDKSIKLLDIDDLTQMAYDFENYTPYWIDSAKSIDDIFKHVNKNILGKQHRIRRY